VRILVVGGGAREHAIAERLAASPTQPDLFVAMKNANPGLVRLAKEHKLVAETDVAAVTEFAVEKRVELAVVGPEAPLEAGLVDALAGKGIFSASPSKAAARIETSKEFMRTLLAKHHVPGQVRHAVFDDERTVARAYEAALLQPVDDLRGCLASDADDPGDLIVRHPQLRNLRCVGEAEYRAGDSLLRWTECHVFDQFLGDGELLADELEEPEGDLRVPIDEPREEVFTEYAHDGVGRRLRIGLAGMRTEHREGAEDFAARERCEHNLAPAGAPSKHADSAVLDEIQRLIRRCRPADEPSARHRHHAHGRCAVADLVVGQTVQEARRFELRERVHPVSSGV
jgi:hypothetical protein